MGLDAAATRAAWVAELPGLYLAVMHSAVMLAPAVSRLVARELVDGTVEPALAGCRPDRF